MSKKVLICPLDWGLGHATRCIPVIKELEKQGCTVLIAGSGPSLELLRIEFPSNKFYFIPSYGISYSAKVPLLLHLIFKTPAILAVMREERRQINDIVEREKIDRIISDNRYGCYHNTIPTAIITHQLALQTPKWMKGIANYYNTKFILRFNQCWVPDTAERSFSGGLSVNSSINPKFLGHLSRFKRVNSPKGPKLLGLVSGPEPQRTIFEELLIKQLRQTQLPYKVVRGLPLSKTSIDNTFNHLPSQELNELVDSAEVIVSRPGYSTIMDLAALKKKAIFVPTPGQTEQIYLARELEAKKTAPMSDQNDFNLGAQLERLKDFSGFTGDYNNKLLQNTLREFLD